MGREHKTGWFGGVLAALVLLAASGVSAQTLAHRGWAGSGLTVETWYEHAVFYEVDPLTFQDSDGDGYGDLRGLAGRLDYLQGLGVDAVVLAPLPLRLVPGSAPALDTVYGSEEDLDRLIGEAGRRKMRVLVEVAVDGAESPAAAVRFWLSRGVGGIRMVRARNRLEAGAPVDVGARVRELRRIAAGYVGQRVLLGDLGAEIGSEVAVWRSRGRPYRGEGAGPQLAVQGVLESLHGLSAVALQSALQVAAGHAALVLASDSADQARSFDRLGDGVHDEAIAKELAAALLLSRGGVLLYFGQEIGMATTPAKAAGPGDPTPMQWGSAGLEGAPTGAGDGFTRGKPWVAMGTNAATETVGEEDGDRESVLHWYRQMSVLHHGNAAVRSGAMQVLHTGDPNLLAWLRRSPGPASAPVLVVMNLSGRSTVAALAGELARAGVRGTVMRTLARSDGAAASGMATANGISMPAFGVFVGELRASAGLETVVLPIRRRRR